MKNISFILFLTILFSTLALSGCKALLSDVASQNDSDSTIATDSNNLTDSEPETDSENLDSDTTVARDSQTDSDTSTIPDSDTATDSDSSTDSDTGVAPITGLVTHFPLDGNLLDYSGNNNNGTAVEGGGFTTDRFGISNGAYLFDGIAPSSYIEVVDPTGLPTGDVPRSFSAWFTMDSTCGTSKDCDVGGFGKFQNSKNFQFGTNWFKKDLTVWGDGSSYDWYSGSPAAQINDGTWRHVVVTYDGTTTKIFLDNAFNVETTSMSWDTEPDLIVLGSFIAKNVHELNGKLDDVKIYDYALSPAEIHDLHHGLVTYFPLDNDLLDYSENKNNATAVEGGGFTTDRFGNSNSAYLFDGIAPSSYIEVSSPKGLPTGDVPRTITAWFTMNSGCGDIKDCDIGGFGQLATGKDFQIGTNYIHDDITIWGVSTSEDWYSGEPATLINDSAWHFIAVTYNGTDTKIYLDNVMIVETNEKTWDTVPENIVFGNFISKDGRELDGVLDELRIYNTALPIEEIDRLFKL